MQSEHRARARDLAKRGQKGFSSVVSEAIDVYLSLEAQREQQRRRALELKGTLSPKEAARLREHTESIRSSWR